MPPKLLANIRESVRERANFLCEYCHTDERWQLIQFTIGHVIPQSEGGRDETENLALACFHCNRRKSNKLVVFDAETGKVAPIYNPREMIWSEHFGWSTDGLKIIPKTSTGRITIGLLDLNRDRILQIRLDDKLVGRHPPIEDLTN